MKSFWAFFTSTGDSDDAHSTIHSPKKDRDQEEVQSLLPSSSRFTTEKFAPDKLRSAISQKSKAHDLKRREHDTKDKSWIKAAFGREEDPFHLTVDNRIPPTVDDIDDVTEKKDNTFNLLSIFNNFGEKRELDFITYKALQKRKIEAQAQKQNLIKLTGNISKPKIPHLFDFGFTDSEDEELTKSNRIILTSVDAISIAPKHVLNSENSTNFLQSPGIASIEPDLRENYVNLFRKFRIPCSTRDNNINLPGDGILASMEKFISRCRTRYKGPDTVLIATPTFGAYDNVCKSAGITYDELPTTEENGFLPNADDLRKKMETLADHDQVYLILCYPNNPTGTLMTERVANEIATVVFEYPNLTVISDEAFLLNIIGENEHFPICAVPGMSNRSITLTSISKSMGTKTCRQAICFSDHPVGKTLGNKPGAQGAAEIIAAALEDNEANRDFIKQSKRDYLGRIEFTKTKIQQLNERFRQEFGEAYAEHVFVKPFIENPQIGGPYLLDFSGLKEVIPGLTGEMIAGWMYNKAKVETVPGEYYFFPDKEKPLARISLSANPIVLNQAFDNIIQAVPSIHEVENWWHLPEESKWQEQFDESYARGVKIQALDNEVKQLEKEVRNLEIELQLRGEENGKGTLLSRHNNSGYTSGSGGSSGNNTPSPTTSRRPPKIKYDSERLVPTPGKINPIGRPPGTPPGTSSGSSYFK